MAKKVQKKKPAPKPAPVSRPKDFLDMAAPSVVKFNTDHAIIGGGYHTFLALRGYAASTEELALLSRLGARDGVNLSVYARQVTAAEEKQIIQNASNRNRLTRSNTSDLQQSVAAESDLQDVAALAAQMHRSREPLIHCAVFLDISAPDQAKLSTLKDFVTAELARSKLTPDPLLLRQREGYQAANPAGFNAFGSQFERVLPAGSAANLYPFNYSGIAADRIPIHRMIDGTVSDTALLHAADNLLKGLQIFHRISVQLHIADMPAVGQSMIRGLTPDFFQRADGVIHRNMEGVRIIIPVCDARDDAEPGLILPGKGTGKPFAGGGNQGEIQSGFLALGVHKFPHVADDFQPQGLGLVAFSMMPANQRCQRLRQTDKSGGEGAVLQHLL